MHQLTKVRSLLMAFACLAGGAHGQISDPNQITGALGFLNSNQDILAILDSPGEEGLWSAIVFADSVTTPDHPIPFNNSASFNIGAPDWVSTIYEITVQSGDPNAVPPEPGIEYAVRADLRLDSGGDRYLTQVVNTLFPHVVFGDPPAVVDLLECAGMLDIRWEDTDGNPVSVTGGNIRAWLESVPGSGVFNFLQAEDFGIPNGLSQTNLAVRGGRNFRVDISFTSGTDPFSDQITFLHQVFDVFVPCDGPIVPIVCVIGQGVGDCPDPCPLGGIVGMVDMLGENEHQIFNRTFVVAEFGPFANFRYDTVGGFPSQGPFELENLVPSAAVVPPLGYVVDCEMNFRTFNRFEYFRTPRLAGVGNNSRVDVSPGLFTDLGDTFVMNPGLVKGNLLFAGPPAAASATGSCLADIFRDSFDVDGVPNNNANVLRSYIEAVGSSSVSPGSVFNAGGGAARVLFEGDFNSGTDDFEGDYELVLGGLDQETSQWIAGRYSLYFQDTVTPTVPRSYQNSFIRVIDNTVPPLDIVPQTEQVVDFAQCYSQVNLSFFSTAGTFFNPRISPGSGTFNGIDFQGNPADYQVFVNLASGTPNSSAGSSTTGLVAMCLPQGSYTFTPFVTANNPDGTTSNTELPPVTLDVGCRQIIDFNSDLQVTISTQIPSCTDEEDLTVSGQVIGTNTIARVFYTLNDGPEVTICTACGSDPPFSFAVVLAECENEIVVSAVDALGIEASVTAFIRFDAEAPVIIDCPGDLTMPLTEAGGIPLDQIPLPTSANDNCDLLPIEVLCVPTPPLPDPLLVPPGTTTFSCTAIDECGNVAKCTFDVTVTGPIGDPYCGPAVPNSTGLSASISATGSAVVNDNDVTLTALDLPTNQFGYFLSSPNQGFIPNPAGSTGNFCLGGGEQLGRYNNDVLNSGAPGTFALAIDLTAIPTTAAPYAILPGDTWNFQAWFRDVGNTNNFTDGVSITFQ